MQKIRPERTDQGSRYVTGVDGMRTLAVVGVIIYHLFIAQLPGGFLGVPLFLLISGYFVTDQLQNEWDQHQTIALISFYRRRFRRLYPPLVGMVLVTVVYICLLYTSESTDQNKLLDRLVNPFRKGGRHEK